MVQKILLVEDDPCFGSVLKSYLELSDYEVTLCVNGNLGLEAFRKERFDICLMDVMMTEMDGFTLGKKIRELDPSVPFVFITAKSLKEDMKLGYEIGADDYIVKPFGVKEVCARVRAVLRRTENQVAPQQEEKIKGGDITVDIVSHTVTKGDKSIELTAKEFDLLVMLMRNSGRVLTRDTLLDRVWGVEYFGDTRTVDVHVRYLRQKIEDNPDTPQLLQTVRGVGYKFVGE